MKTLRLVLIAAAVISLAACATPGVDPASVADPDQAAYPELYPYYAEICALSQLQKKPGFGAELHSGIGGHASLYLNGACRDTGADYPVIGMCDEIPAGKHSEGVGLSVNAHYANANWVAVEDKDFFFGGDLAPGAGLTKSIYHDSQALAASKGFLTGVTFHDEYFDGMPAGFTKTAYQYEISIATDFAIEFGRNRFCGRVPLSRPQMRRIVHYLNALNAPYRGNKATYEWDLLEHNCAHVNHNALAAADIWDEWETDRFVLVSLVDFPVPMNEFVNLMRRTNDLPIDDLDALYDDGPARRLLLSDHRLPTEPGALAEFGHVREPNEIYDTDTRILFYDDPMIGSYAPYFRRILAEPRYFRLRDNLIYFKALYDRIERSRQPVAWYLSRRTDLTDQGRRAFQEFYETYFRYIADQDRATERQLATLTRQ